MAAAWMQGVEPWRHAHYDYRETHDGTDDDDDEEEDEVKGETLSDDLDRDEAEESEIDDDWDVRDDLSANLQSIKRTGDFYSHFATSTALNPGLEIEGLRRFGMPLSEYDVKAIIAESHRAPYGRGTETLVNEDVRRTWEIDGRRIRLHNPAWPTDLDKLLNLTCQKLGVAGGSASVEAQLYKLLVYEEGAMFKPHKDSEKAPRMFGTLVVSLPCLHSGGDLVISFGGKSRSLATSKNSEWSSTCMPWYSDVLHEVKPVTSGYRVVLTFNLVAKGAAATPSLTSFGDHISSLRKTLKRWSRTSSPEFLIYKLDHEYTQASIEATRLKGADIYRVQCLMKLQEELGLKLCIASLEKMVTGGCDDPGYGYRGYRDYGRYGRCYDDWQLDDDDDDEHHSIDDEIDRSVKMTSVFDLQGNEIAEDVDFDEEEHLVQSELFDREPDEEDYEGHTGNAGASATHWYRNMALVIVPEANWYSFILNNAARDSGTVEELLDDELAKFRADPENQRVRATCARICEAAIEKRWCDRANVLAVVFDACTTIGRNDLAGKAISTTTGCRYRTVAESLLVLQFCQAIERADLMDDVVLNTYCQDFAQLMTMFDRCLVMNRVELAARLVEKQGLRFSIGSTIEQTRSFLNTIMAQSVRYSFADVRECLDIAFGSPKDLKVYSQICKAITLTWQERGPAEREMIEVWKRTFMEKILDGLENIEKEDQDIMKEFIATQGTGWILGFLVPLAIRKNTEGGKGKLRFTISVIALLYVLEPAAIDREFRGRAVSALAPSAIAGLSLNAPIGDTTNARPGYAWNQPTVSPTGKYKALAGRLEYLRGAFVHMGLTDAQSIMENRMLEQCKALDASRSSEDFVGEILTQLARRTGMADPSLTERTTWFRDLVVAFIVRVVGFEPAAPSGWVPPRRLGCAGGCSVCNDMNRFLLGPALKQRSFPMAQHNRKHMETQLSGSPRTAGGTWSNAQFSVHTTTRGSPHTLNITKSFGDFDANHAQWTEKFTRARGVLENLGSPARRQALLGLNSEDIVTMKIVSLQRLPTGHAIPGRYQAPMPLPIEIRPATYAPPYPLVASGSAVNNQSPPRMPGPDVTVTGGLKRKASDEENAGPVKKVTPVVDLCDSD